MEESLVVAGMGDVVRRAHEARAAEESDSQDSTALAQYVTFEGVCKMA